MTNSVFLHLQLLSFSSFKMHKQTTEDILKKFFFFFLKKSNQVSANVWTEVEILLKNVSSTVMILTKPKTDVRFSP